MNIMWLEDKEKNGEIFSNSDCLTYVVKLFIREKRVELWGQGKGVTKEFQTNEEAFEHYNAIKKSTYQNIWKNAEKK